MSDLEKLFTPMTGVRIIPHSMLPAGTIMVSADIWALMADIPMEDGDQAVLNYWQAQINKRPSPPAPERDT